MVRASKGQVLGWYVYLLPERGVAQVLQGASRAGNRTSCSTTCSGRPTPTPAAPVRGRVEPVVAGLMSRPRVVVRKSARSLVHSVDSAVLALLGSSKSLLKPRRRRMARVARRPSVTEAGLPQVSCPPAYHRCREELSQRGTTPGRRSLARMR